MDGAVLETCLKELDRVFHSEADLQHALALRLDEQDVVEDIRLEKRWDMTDEDAFEDAIYTDIYLDTSDGGVPIELKYKTDEFSEEIAGEEFALKSQSAQDVTRYDYIWDLHRLETLVHDGEDCDAGFALLLTNDHLYWQDPTRDDVIDRDFRLHDDIDKESLEWAERTSDGTKGQKRSDPIELEESYAVEWRDYTVSMNDTSDGIGFRYLLIEVN